MALFRRNKRASDDPDAPVAPKKEKGSWRRPANTAFKQQRLKAWQPILTPKTVLPTLFIIGIIFAPIGGLLVWGSGLVSEMSFDYTDCEKQPASSSTSDLTFYNLTKYSYKLKSSETDAPYNPPQFAFVNRSTDSSIPLAEQAQCFIQFDVPINLEPSVFLYYKLTNFYQNHRRYVNSYDANQLKGQYVSPSTLNKGDCKPLAIRDGKAIYPCGLIANSLYNDSYSALTSTTDSSTVYNFSSSGIAWPGEAKKYATSPAYNISEIVPPPNWHDTYPDGYTEDNPPPDLKTNEHFQNWMRTAGLPTFTKLYGRNDDTTLVKGRYQITVNLNYPVLPYSGTKSVVISTVSWIGGKNPFLGWAYVASAALLVFLAILGTIRHMIRPRKLGDMSLLSWNR
ncbi:cell cycle control protein [Laetiporus sulphureus 93-53]|uniref:Cell cycle control protein n=1 Tax=Laetiporus sulphureus 93-53 TaxID=1314785 RepID=A0A165CW99_9APHY|nr:cell cycle control protein [Laetiporus sulphureus 93-53]KZT03567.1 cell cycle control protein [Laetiporus sulphureus 93-53]